MIVSKEVEIRLSVTITHCNSAAFSSSIALIYIHIQCLTIMYILSQISYRTAQPNASLAKQFDSYEGGTVECQVWISMTNGYSVPKIAAKMESVKSKEDAPSAHVLPRQWGRVLMFVHKLNLKVCAQAKEASGWSLGEGSSRDFKVFHNCFIMLHIASIWPCAVWHCTWRQKTDLLGITRGLEFNSTKAPVEPFWIFLASDSKMNFQPENLVKIRIISTGS